MTGTRIATVAAVIAALGIGVLLGLAAPHEGTPQSPVSRSASATPVDGDNDAERWLAELAPASTVGRLDGMRIVLVATATATDEDRAAVEEALIDAGGTVPVVATLGEQWWDAQWGTFRAELADNLGSVVQGVPDASPQVLLSHAIVQALVPGAVPESDSPSPSPSPENPVVLDESQEMRPTEVIRTSLERADILSIDELEPLEVDDNGVPIAPEPLDAIVLVTGEGPEAAGTVAARAAAIWEEYVPSTLLVVVHDEPATAAHSTATDVIAGVEEASAGERPSVVLVTARVLIAPQVVFALVEQRDGGTGVYGTVDNHPIVPSS